MKSSFVFFVILFFLFACTNGSKHDQNLKVNEENAYNQGLNLINANDCVACHKLDEKLTGPSYSEIAAKYNNTPENIEMLAQKIIKGGQGVWGVMVMLPHPKISEADAKKMAEYILSLKQ